MNKQELIEKLKSDLTAMSEFEGSKYEYGKGYRCATKQHLEMLSDLDESEKPVVPQYVDTWVQGCKYNGFDLYEAMTAIEMPMEFDRWLETNSETFAKAWLYGYEVEKEKLYIVELPSPNCKLDDHYALSRLKNGKIIINKYYIEQWERFGDCQLTESEIKQDFEWAWQFAKEVE